MKPLIIRLVIFLLILGGLVFGGWYIYNNYLKSDLEVYSEAVARSISTEPQDIFVSYEFESERINYKGEVAGDLSGDNTTTRADIDVESTTEGIPVTLSAEAIGVTRDGKTEESYVRIKDISTQTDTYKGVLQNYYEPVKDKWQKLESTEEDEDKPTSVEENGPLALLDVMAIFAPIGQLSEEDKAKYVEILEKYNLYELVSGFEKTDFKGVDANKLVVKVNKDRLAELENELDSALSNEAKFKKFESSFLDNVFGIDETLQANIYLDKSKKRIIGVEVDTELINPITENEFDTRIRQINGSIFIDVDRKSEIEIPGDAISEEEYSKLLSQEQS